MINYKENYNKWLEDNFFDEETREELSNLIDEKEIEDRFYRDLEFGTGGLRGVMGAGTNRMNKYTIGKATKGLGTYLLDHYGVEVCAKKGVVIGYDTRNNSKDFSEITANVLTGMGIKVFLHSEARPTPQLSFSVKFLNSEVEKEIQQHLKRGMLIPILGSGFSRGCNSRSGKVPSGDDYKKYMIDEIMKARGYDSSRRINFEKKQFSEISTIYHKVISIEDQRRYLRNNFTRVELSDEKKKLLEINWPYIYTLNTDDAIEKNSKYNNVIYSNRKIWDDIFDEDRCTIKLHGHVDDILSYVDSKCEIFDQTQYVQSLTSNRILLDKLKHDYEYLNLIYIGCSLSNEIDLLSVAAGSSSNGSHYYCTVNKPDKDDMILLSEYGITHCVLFDSYNAIYTELAASANEAEKIDSSDLDNHKTFEFTELPDGFDKNKSYLFHGKNPVDSNRKVQLPSFFVSREIADDIVKNVKIKGTQIIVGPGCSGKTYVALDIARRVVDRDVFVFQSRETINDIIITML